MGTRFHNANPHPSYDGIRLEDFNIGLGCVSKGSLPLEPDNMGDDHNTPARVTDIQKARLMVARRMIEDEKPRIEYEATPHDLGRAGYHAGTSNPFNPITEPDQFDEWADGYNSM